MTGVTICMEGGGNTGGTRRQLRRGMDRFLHDLKRMALERRWQWQLIPCGGRQQAYDTFRNKRDCAGDGEIVILLVDAEAPVTAPTPVEYLRTRRGGGWDLNGVDEKHVHLMVQVMETWIIADSEALSDYYGQGFRANILPTHEDLEKVDKTTVADALDRATKQTKKRSYHKIRHAADLLERINPKKVQERCRHCKRLFVSLEASVAKG